MSLKNSKKNQIVILTKELFYILFNNAIFQQMEVNN
jgi:hypothetical protein